MSAEPAPNLFQAEAAAIHKHIAAGEREFGLAARELVSVRDRLRHGQWLPWLEVNGFARSTAHRLIQEYHHPDKADERRASNAARERENRKRPTCETFDDNIVEFPELSRDDRPDAVREFEEGPVAWLNRAASAKTMATYAPIETCPSSRKMLEAAREVVEAWNLIIKHVEEEMSHEQAS